MKLLQHIQKLPNGYSEVRYNDTKYGVTKSVFNNGKSFKVFASKLGGKDFISLNYYCTRQREILKPCEMPEAKVIHFLENYELIC
jgi:peptide-methionine (S)-S-oxide reductase